MELLKLALKEHRGLIVLAAGVLALIILFSVVRCTTVQVQRGQAAQEEDGTVQVAGSVGTDDGEQEDSAESKALAKLTDEQRKRQGSYDEQTAYFVSQLSSSIWSARKDTYILTFTPKTFTEQVDGKETVHPYVLSDMLMRSPTTSGKQKTEVTEAVLETDEGSFVLTHTLVTNTETGKSTSRITSSAFSIVDQTGYTRAGASDNALTVGEVNSSFSAMIDGKTDAMEKALREFCAANCPTATKATWGNMAVADWKEQTVTTRFDLNNSGKTSVSIVYNTEKGEFTVENSYNAS